jgi:adenosylcobinamide-phosphate synthase
VALVALPVSMPVLSAFSVAAAMGLLLLAACCIDHIWGEPPVRLHPVVWMGKYLQACGAVIARRPPAAAFVLGALAWLVGGSVVALVTWEFQVYLVQLLARLTGTLFGAPESGESSLWLLLPLFIFMAWLLKAMLSWRMLRDETGAVEVALQCSLEAGQERLSWLVSRDTSTLSEIEVRESAIETLAENLNDSVVAPIFWFVLLGLPGAAFYRFANTADAMWGYRGFRNGSNWEWAGKWAAGADDALSWVPARLTAALLALVAGGVGPRTLRLEAAKTPSPNSGWPMAAMALALGVSLRKPGTYVLNAGGRLTTVADTFTAQKNASKVVVMAVLCAEAAIFLIAFVIST